MDPPVRAEAAAPSGPVPADANPAGPGPAPTIPVEGPASPVAGSGTTLAGSATAPGGSATSSPGAGQPPDAPHGGSSLPPMEPPPKPLLERVPGWVVPAVIVLVPLLVFGLAQAAPEQVGDEFVWKYYWGPIYADANDCNRGTTHNAPAGTCDPSTPGGIVAYSGYNAVNTLSWAALLGVCIFGLAQLLHRRKTVMGSTLVMGAVGWVVAGSVFHVLEDVALFAPPLQYLFITPPIFLLFAAMGVATFVLGGHLEGVARRAGVERALQKLWLTVSALVLAYLLMWLNDWGQVKHYVHPILVALCGLSGYAVAAWRFRRLGRIDASELVGYMSIGWILLSLVYMAEFVRAPWHPSNPGPVALWAPVIALVAALVLRWMPKRIVAYIALGIAAVIVPPLAVQVLGEGLVRLGTGWPIPPLGTQIPVIVWAVATVGLGIWMFRRFERSRPALEPRMAAAGLLWINALLVFAQVLDGVATAIGIDHLQYTEKHVLSAKIIDWTCMTFGGEVVDARCLEDGAWWLWGAEHPTFLGFLPVKLLVSLLVIYAIDVANPKDAERHPTIIGIVKFAIIMVGLGPGIRDFVRMALGV